MEVRNVRHIFKMHESTADERRCFEKLGNLIQRESPAYGGTPVRAARCSGVLGGADVDVGGGRTWAPVVRPTREGVVDWVVRNGGRVSRVGSGGRVSSVVRGARVLSVGRGGRVSDGCVVVGAMESFNVVPVGDGEDRVVVVAGATDAAGDGFVEPGLGLGAVLVDRRVLLARIVVLFACKADVLSD